MSPAPRSPAGEDRGPGVAGQLGEYAGFGLTIAGATALFAWLGTRLDAWLGTESLFVLIGAFLGFAAGFYSMYWRLVLRRSGTRDGEDEEAEPRDR